MIAPAASAAAQFLTGALPAALAAGGVAFAGAAYLSISPASRAWGPILTHGSPDGPPRYALTFAQRRLRPALAPRPRSLEAA